MKSIRSDEEAVSPVIGVILMVAIVVILAAIIAAFVFGMVGTSPTTKSVALTVQMGKVGTTSDVGVITIQGGNDVKYMTVLNWSLNGATPAKVTSATDGTTVPTTYKVGDVLSTGTTSVLGKRLVLTATFADGVTQVVFDKDF
jgi:archaeal type IV pilus assembly protein PilA